MIRIFKQARGSGKTTKAIELLEENKNSLCLVPNNHIKTLLFPKKLKDRVVTYGSEIIFELNKRHCNKLIVDELVLDKFDTAELFYYLGLHHIDVIVYGSD